MLKAMYFTKAPRPLLYNSCCLARRGFYKPVLAQHDQSTMYKYWCNVYVFRLKHYFYCYIQTRKEVPEF